MSATAASFPGLGFDPAPGVPSSIATMVAKVSRATEVLDQCRCTLAGVSASGGLWRGEAAEAFSTTLGELPHLLDRAFESLQAVGRELDSWSTSLAALQGLARAHEADAVQLRERLRQAQANPDLNLAGQHFDTDQALADAQHRLNRAQSELDAVQGELDAVLAKGRELQAEHAYLAGRVAANIRTASETAPDEPGLLDGFLREAGEFFTSVLEIPLSMAGWIRDHANSIAAMGDVLSTLSTVVSLIGLVFDATGAGAVVGIPLSFAGAALSAAALITHGVAAEAGASGVTRTDLAMDALGSIPVAGVLSRFGASAADMSVDSAGLYVGIGDLGVQSLNISDIFADGTLGYFVPQNTRQTTMMGTAPGILATAFENAWSAGAEKDAAAAAEREAAR
ncbi:hypothetical protein [Allostreptomyces psammosilenae]|uniref:WXG100 family type VII secretion target n=1 Tax=Allostreptomyces psammosilenae TaxID=1892865 RepID=A0A853A7U4_9ACTN|nr:hypothetical protein [Allostreptomyces psammosilenae]NYI06512.1 hypothetical protein [Allostreptomyces psammosilenae]